MAQKHRKLFPTNSTDCEIFPCEPYSEIPPDPEFFLPLPPPPPPPQFSSSATTTLSPYLIISLSIFSAVLVLLIAYVVLAKRCFRRPRHDGEQDFLDHNHGPEIDHPIWYINTVGLQSSVINSIAIFKYKMGNSPIKENTCSVCLSEFVEDETLRLLPKCKHAFHIACIDTWLRSHTNCPLCRALILSNVTRESLDETSNENANSGYNADVSGNLGITNENMRERETETEDMSGSKEISYTSVVSLMREKGKRSVSMDSLMAMSIGSCSCDFPSDQLHGNLVSERDEKQINGLGINRTRYNGNLRIGSSSSVESLHMSPISMKRSFSCSGRLFSSSRYNNKSSSSILPL